MIDFRIPPSWPARKQIAHLRAEVAGMLIELATNAGVMLVP